MGIRSWAMTAVVLAALAVTGCRVETTLAIRPDGTCTIRTECTAARDKVVKLLEDEFERPGAEEHKPYKEMTDAELLAVLRKRFLPNEELAGRKIKTEALEVKDGQVRAVLATTRPSVKELVASLYGLGQQVFPPTERIVVEKDAEGHLRLSIERRQVDADEIAEALERLKTFGVKMTYRFELPGKVLSSPLPHTKDNATWLTIDAASPDAEKTLAKLMGKPTVITAELGGLRLDERLDSKVLAKPPALEPEARRAELPLVEAGAVFAVRPIAVTIVAYHLLREQPLLVQKHERELRDARGVTIEAELLLPEKKVLLSAEKVRVVEAVDDQGRKVEPGREQTDIDLTPTPLERLRGRVPMILRLGLPQRDAKALTQVKGEAVLVVGSGWKRLELPNAQADPKREIDLAAVLPGAKIVIRGIDRQKVTVKIEGTGPYQVVDDLEFDLKFPGGEELKGKRGGHSMSGRRGGYSGTLWIRFVEPGEPEGAPPGEPTLVVRYPDNVQRERVTFTLHNIPLLEPAPAETEF